MTLKDFINNMDELTSQVEKQGLNIDEVDIKISSSNGEIIIYAIRNNEEIIHYFKC